MYYQNLSLSTSSTVNATLSSCPSSDSLTETLNNLGYTVANVHTECNARSFDESALLPRSASGNATFDILGSLVLFSGPIGTSTSSLTNSFIQSANNGSLDSDGITGAKVMSPIPYQPQDRDLPGINGHGNGGERGIDSNRGMVWIAVAMWTLWWIRY